MRRNRPWRYMVPAAHEAGFRSSLRRRLLLIMNYGQAVAGTECPCRFCTVISPEFSRLLRIPTTPLFSPNIHPTVRPIRAAETAEAEASSMMKIGRAPAVAAIPLIQRDFLRSSARKAAASHCQETFRIGLQKPAIPTGATPSAAASPDAARFRVPPNGCRDLARSGKPFIRGARPLSP